MEFLARDQETKEKMGLQPVLPVAVLDLEPVLMKGCDWWR